MAEHGGLDTQDPSEFEVDEEAGLWHHTTTPCPFKREQSIPITPAAILSNTKALHLCVHCKGVGSWGQAWDQLEQIVDFIDTVDNLENEIAEKDVDVLELASAAGACVFELKRNTLFERLQKHASDGLIALAEQHKRRAQKLLKQVQTPEFLKKVDAVCKEHGLLALPSYLTGGADMQMLCDKIGMTEKELLHYLAQEETAPKDVWVLCNWVNEIEELAAVGTFPENAHIKINGTEHLVFKTPLTVFAALATIHATQVLTLDDNCSEKEIHQLAKLPVKGIQGLRAIRAAQA